MEPRSELPVPMPYTCAAAWGFYERPEHSAVNLKHPHFDKVREEIRQVGLLITYDNGIRPGQWMRGQFVAGCNYSVMLSARHQKMRKATKARLRKCRLVTFEEACSRIIDFVMTMDPEAVQELLRVHRRRLENNWGRKPTSGGNDAMPVRG